MILILVEKLKKEKTLWAYKTKNKFVEKNH